MESLFGIMKLSEEQTVQYGEILCVDTFTCSALMSSPDQGRVGCWKGDFMTLHKDH
jgi:hypothetical protein